MTGRMKKIILLAGMVLFVLCNICNIAIHVSGDLFGFSDMNQYWIEFRLTLKGGDTGYYIHTGKTIAGAENIYGVPLFPWSKILGNFICPGFLPQEAAVKYSLDLLIILCGITGWQICRRMEKSMGLQGKERVLRGVMVVLIFMMPFFWRDMITFMNPGGIISIILILMALCSEDHPWISALLLAIAMTKPQSAAPFVLVLLLEKRWKTVITGGILTGISWIVCSILTGIAPLRQLSYVSEPFTEEVPYYYWYGLMDPLRDLLGANIKITMMCSMVAGLIFLFGLYYLVKKNQTLKNDVIAIYSGAAVVSTLWMYKSKSDFPVVILASALVLEYFFRFSGNTWKSMIMLALLNSLFFTEPVRVLLGYSFTTGMTLDAWGRLLAVVWITIELLRKKLPLRK